MKQIILPVTVHLNIRLPLALLQPEPAAAPTGPEPEVSSIGICEANSSKTKTSCPKYESNLTPFLE